MTDLAEILSSGNIILVDGSIEFERKYHNLLNRVKGANFFNEILLGFIEPSCNNMDRLYELLQKNNVWTIKGVSNEIKILGHVLNRNINRISINHEAAKKFDSNYALNKLNSDTQLNRDMLVSLKDKAYLVSEQAHQKGIQYNPEIHFDSRKYNSILAKTVEISNLLKLKNMKTSRSTNNSYTDEEMTAAILYLSMFSHKKPVLLTADRDFLYLLGIVPEKFGSTPTISNRDFKNALKYNPFKLYLEQHKSFELSLDSSKNVKFDEYNKAY